MAISPAAKTGKAAKPIPRLPRESLLLGSFPHFNADRLGFLTAATQAYPDIVRFRLGPIRAAILNAPDLIQSVLVERGDSFGKAPLFLRATRDAVGDNLLTIEGARHRRHRRLMAPALTPRHIAAYAATMADYADRRRRSWPDGATIDLVAECGALAMEIACKTLFDVDIAEDVAILSAAVANNFAYLEYATSHVWTPPLSWPTPRNRRTRRATALISRRIRAMIAERRADPLLAERGDLLSMLVKARDGDGSALTDEELCGEAIALFAAGHETTAKTLAWALYELCRHPDVYARAREEVDTVLQARLPAYEDLARLPYATQVIKETLRVYPPGYFLGRYALHDVPVGDYVLAKGTLALLSAYTLHRRADYYPDPLAFKPERFADNMEKSLPRYAYSPFGAGAHVCPGSHFAMMEAPLVLAALLQTHDFVLAATHPVEPGPAFVLAPRGPIMVKVHRRADGAAGQIYGIQNHPSSRPASV